MSINHIVAFKVSEQHIPAFSKAFLDLETTCTRDGKTYIKSVKGGKQHSPEGKHHDMSVCFIMTFDNPEDLDYYIWRDPAHDAFKKAIGSMGVEGVVVFDFTNGQW